MATTAVTFFARTLARTRYVVPNLSAMEPMLTRLMRVVPRAPPEPLGWKPLFLGCFRGSAAVPATAPTFFALEPTSTPALRRPPPPEALEPENAVPNWGLEA